MENYPEKQEHNCTPEEAAAYLNDMTLEEFLKANANQEETIMDQIAESQLPQKQDGCEPDCSPTIHTKDCLNRKPEDRSYIVSCEESARAVDAIATLSNLGLITWRTDTDDAGIDEEFADLDFTAHGGYTLSPYLIVSDGNTKKCHYLLVGKGHVRRALGW
jgi:hypothetical protein